MNIFAQAAELEEANVPFALITITSSSGSTPRSQARMIVLADGQTYGTVGGGVSEYEAVQRAQELIPLRKSETFSKSLAVGDGHNCGGALEMFIEVIGSRPRLILVGGGHVNLEIANLAFRCSFQVEVVETRAEYASLERFPHAGRLYTADTIEEALAQVTIDSDTALIIATHSLDQQALEQVLHSPAWYIGMLGSRNKIHTFRKRLKEKLGIDISSLTQLYAPLGLDIGARSPEEIAVSALSELMKIHSRRSGMSLRDRSDNLVVVRGGGDLASAVISRLFKAGYRVLALEVEKPTAIRRTVSYSTAIHAGSMTLDGLECVFASDTRVAKSIMDEHKIAIMIDPEGATIQEMHPLCVVDAIIAKKNLGTHMGMAPFVIALGPGFSAGKDCHVVVETNRGHYLGSVITDGEAAPNTGVPGVIGGQSAKRVIHSKVAGVFTGVRRIGDIVKEGDVVARIDGVEVLSPLDGVLRGILDDGLTVPVGFKIGDVDPRGDVEHCFTISDKGRAIAGGVLEALDGFRFGLL